MIAGSSLDFTGLQMFYADMIMIDPPWNFHNYSEKGEKKGAKQHYETMSAEEIKALQVGDYVTSPSVLLLWATAPQLPLALECMAGWGFAYKSHAVWLKKTVNNKTRMGTGYICRSCHELLLVGTMGQPAIKAQKSVIEGRAREHSRKPDEAYAWAEQLFPEATRRYDIFSREDRPGWTSWGDETGKFNNELY